MACGNLGDLVGGKRGDDSSAKIIARRRQNIRLFEGERSPRARRYADCGISVRMLGAVVIITANRAHWTGNDGTDALQSGNVSSVRTRVPVTLS